MPIFQKRARIIGISDRMILNGFTFDAKMLVSERNGDWDAIHCGRILFLEILCDDEVVAYFDKGIWYQTPDEDFGPGVLAKEAFIEKWSRLDSVKEWIAIQEAFASNKDREEDIYGDQAEYGSLRTVRPWDVCR